MTDLALWVDGSQTLVPSSGAEGRQITHRAWSGTPGGRPPGTAPAEPRSGFLQTQELGTETESQEVLQTGMTKSVTGNLRILEQSWTAFRPE